MLVFLSQKQLMEFGHVDLCFLVVADLFNFSESYSSLNIQRIILYHLGICYLLIHLNLERSTSYYFKLPLFYDFTFLYSCQSF